MVKKNLMANYIGQGWITVVGLVFIPLYIKYLGIEAYGVIGFYAVLRSSLMLFDMGVAPTLGREMAHFTSGAQTLQYVHNLIRSAEIIMLIVAIAIIIGMGGAASYLTHSWLSVETIPLETIQKIFMIMGFVIALGLIENIYRSSLLGLQKQVLFNIITSFVATLRSVGAVIVLMWISPTLGAFFIWQGIVSIISITLFVSSFYLTINFSGTRGNFSFSIIQSVWKFAGGMIGITFLSLLLMQTDKILLSKLLSLSEYGYYTLAVAVAGGISILLGPIGQAWFPRFNELYASRDEKGFVRAYHQSSQLISVVVGSIAIVLIVFSKNVLHLWTQDSVLTSQTASIMSLLVAGNLLNGLMWMPYQAQLAHGWTSLSIRINMIAVILIVPAILLVAPHYGALGAAWIWVGLNAGYVIIGVHFMYQKILINEKWQWYLYDSALPIMTAALVAVLIAWLIPNNLNFIEEGAVLIIAFVLTLLSAITVAPLIREQVWSYLVTQKKLL